MTIKKSSTWRAGEQVLLHYHAFMAAKLLTKRNGCPQHAMSAHHATISAMDKLSCTSVPLLELLLQTTNLVLHGLVFGLVLQLRNIFVLNNIDSSSCWRS
jgi:hypothetical protein